MCTLILGRDVLGPGSLIVGANRDEDPARTAEPPAVLARSPHLVGGRDVRGGGTWLAIRHGRAVVAVLNRRGAPPPAPQPLRSRGLLALDVAAAAPEATDDAAFAAAALDAARAELAARAYAPLSLVCATPRGGWVLAHGGPTAGGLLAIGPGWHVLTHASLDDPQEPRTVRLTRKLERFRPRDTGEAETRVLEVLSLHGSFGDGAPPTDGGTDTDPAAADQAAVCIHDGRMVTVSTSVFRRSRAGGRYIHIEGRPCTSPPRDLTSLLAP